MDTANERSESELVSVPDNATCLDCGYALRGLSDSVCVECGRAFIPGDETSYQIWEGVYSWRRWARPPTLRTIVPIVVLSLWFLNEVSVPGRSLSACFLIVSYVAFMVYGVADVAWRWSACRRDAERASLDRLRRRYGRWRWVVLPIAVVSAISLCVVNWPLRMRFALSRAAFEAAQSQLDGAVTLPAGRRWIGLFHVEIRREGRYIYYVTGQTSLMGEGGFGKGTRVEGELSVGEHVAGDWYVVHERFN